MSVLPAIQVYSGILQVHNVIIDVVVVVSVEAIQNLKWLIRTLL